MQATILVIFTLTVGSAIAGYAGGYGYHHGTHDYHAYPAYKFSYGVKDKVTGDFKQAEEERDGEITRGSYSLLQPDGVLRTVKYWVSPKTGFQATVFNSGIGVHSKYHHGVAKGVDVIV